MKNQSSGKGGGSAKIQAMVDAGSKKVSGKGSATGSSNGKLSGPGKAASQSGATGTIVPASEKGGHV